MELQEKMDLLADVMDMEADEFSPQTELGTLENWDSMTRLSLIVMMEDEFGKSLNGEQVRAFETIQDILGMME